jgi:hypothetical protein
MPLSRQDQGPDAFDRRHCTQARTIPQRLALELRQCDRLESMHAPIERPASLRPPLSILSVDRAIANLNDWHSFPEVWINLLARTKSGFDPSHSEPCHGYETAPTPYVCRGYFDREDLESELNQLLHRSPKGTRKRTQPCPSPAAMRDHGFSAIPLQLDEQFDRIEAWLASIESEMPPAPPPSKDRLSPTSPSPFAPLASAPLSRAIPTPAVVFVLGSIDASPYDPPIQYGATNHPESVAWRILVQPSSTVPAHSAATATWIASPETMAWTTMACTTNRWSPSDRPRGTGKRPSRATSQPTRAAKEKRTVPEIGGRFDRSRPHRGKPFQRMPIALRDRDATTLNLLSSA